MKGNLTRNIAYALLFSFGLFMLAFGSTRAIENYRLSKYGKPVKAKVINTRLFENKVINTFRYAVGDSVYNLVWNDEHHRAIGDSVDMLYLENSPEVIRPYQFIKENYSTDIKLPR